MLLSVHPLVSGAIMTICYVLSNLNNNIETFSFVYDNGTDGKVLLLDLWFSKFWLICSFKFFTVLVRRPSQNPNPMATLADVSMRRINCDGDED